MASTAARRAAGGSRPLAAGQRAGHRPRGGAGPGSVGESKRWTYYPEAARLLVERGLDVWVVGGPGEKALAQEIVAAGGGKVRDLTGTDLRNGILAMAAASVAISNDFGLMHIAAAIGTPTMGIFGPTSPYLWAPLNGLAATVLQTKAVLPCQPCQRTVCTMNDHRCMRDIDPRLRGRNCSARTAAGGSSMNRQIEQKTRGLSRPRRRRQPGRRLHRHTRADSLDAECSEERSGASMTPAISCSSSPTSPAWRAVTSRKTEVNALHDWMCAELAAQGAVVDDIRYCPHHPGGSIAGYLEDHHWRKPSPGMIHDLIQHWPVHHAGSFVIGDRPTDIEAAEAAGLPGFLFTGGDLDAFIAEVIARTKVLQTAAITFAFPPPG